MSVHATRAAIPLLAMLLAAPAARADIYTWVDAAGTLNVSNLAPPSGVEVINVVVHRDPPPVPPNLAGDVARDAELQALNARVEALRDELEQAQHRATTQAAYWPAPPPPQPVVYDASDAQGYVYDTAPVAQASASCDPSWWGCLYGWNPYAAYAYPAVIVAGNARSVRHDGGVHRPPMRPPTGHAMGPPPRPSRPPFSPPPRMMAMARRP